MSELFISPKGELCLYVGNKLYIIPGLIEINKEAEFLAREIK